MTRDDFANLKGDRQKREAALRIGEKWVYKRYDLDQISRLMPPLRNISAPPSSLSVLDDGFPMWFGVDVHPKRGKGDFYAAFVKDDGSESFFVSKGLEFHVIASVLPRYVLTGRYKDVTGTVFRDGKFHSLTAKGMGYNLGEVEVDRGRGNKTKVKVDLFNPEEINSMFESEASLSSGLFESSRRSEISEATAVSFRSLHPKSQKTANEILAVLGGGSVKDAWEGAVHGDIVAMKLRFPRIAKATLEKLAGVDGIRWTEIDGDLATFGLSPY